MTKKFCVHCKHHVLFKYEYVEPDHLCKRWPAEKRIDLVTGEEVLEQQQSYCSLERSTTAMGESFCGPEGKYFSFVVEDAPKVEMATSGFRGMEK